MLSYLVAALLGGISVNYDINPYRVYGKNLSEVLESIEKLGPKDQYGVQRHAYAGWDFKWSWNKGFKDPKVILNLSITHPAWDGNCEEWGRYMGALISHELNHLNHALETAKKIKDTIDNAAGLSEKQLSIKLQHLLKKNRDFDLRYDEETENGRHEGVLLDTNAC